KRLVQAILDGAQQIATPAFVSTLSICIVFVPVVFLTGPAKYLFTPLAMAVVFAMLASYVLSRTIVPTLVRYLLASEAHGPVDAAIRRLIPKDQVQLVIDNIGQPQPINLAFTDSVTLGPSDGEILVSLNPERHQSTEHWMKTLRETLPRDFPGVTFFFQPADIVSQILNFGLPAPIDVQVTGFNQQATHEIALEVAARMARIPGAADVHLHQVVNTPS